MPGPGIEPMTARSEVQHSNHCATETHVLHNVSYISDCLYIVECLLEHCKTAAVRNVYTDKLEGK